MYGGNVEIIAVTETYKMIVSIYFPSEREVSDTLTLAIHQVAA
jgi:hypothetical protein